MSRRLGGVFTKLRCFSVGVARALRDQAIILAILVCAVATSTGRAEPIVADSNPYTALRSYAEEVGLPQNHTRTLQEDADPVFAALRDFSARLPDARGESTSPSEQIKTAAADNAFDALREYLQKGNQQAPTPSETPKKKAPESAAPEQPRVAVNYVGTKVCLGCHSSQATEFDHTLMGRLAKQGKLTCESCHGGGSEHVRLGGGRGVGGIISFRPDDNSRTAEENNRICEGCHDRGQRINWPGSVHETRGLMCTNCHTIMKSVSRKNQLKTAWEPDTCFQCHKDRRAQMFRSSHMPMREGSLAPFQAGDGKMVCSDCHNPHGSFTEALLKKDSINDVCYTCHAEKRGPFLFEHSPVRENCLNCHDPHGSINDYSLKLPRPRLCYECHNLMSEGTVGRFDVHGGLGQSCQNCHVQIHGTNAPGGSLLGR